MESVTSFTKFTFFFHLMRKENIASNFEKGVQRSKKFLSNFSLYTLGENPYFRDVIVSVECIQRILFSLFRYEYTTLMHYGGAQIQGKYRGKNESDFAQYAAVGYATVPKVVKLNLFIQIKLKKTKNSKIKRI